MGKVNHQVKTNYKLYNQLKIKRKTVLSSPINIDKPKSSNKSFKIGESAVTHISIAKTLHFQVEVKVDNFKDFKFRLFCNDLFDSPFFRFDSAGPSHRNNDPDIPLRDQQVTTPHFHEFNKKGIEIAYKTEALQSQTQLLKLEDVNICIMHFCEEGNLRYKKTDFPEVNLHGNELGLNFITDDPLKNVDF